MSLNFLLSNVSCSGNDGEIGVIVSGGEAPYTYNWSSGDTTSEITGLGSGWYNVTVTDSRGCQVEDSVEVLGFEPISVNFILSNVSCNGNDGEIDVIVTGGEAPYTYNWSNGEDTSYISNLVSGMYIVTVTDKNGCVAIDSVEVLHYVPIQVLSNVLPVTCHNNDGAIDLFVSGGYLPYSYIWDTGDTLQDIDSLSAGVYHFTITDARGCQFIDSVVVAEQLPPVINLSVSEILCAGDSTATIFSEVVGDNEPYTVVWYLLFSDTALTDTILVDTSFTITNMPAGNYLVRVIDVNNCQYFDSITVVEPDSIKLEFDVIPENCKNTKTGAIQLTVHGGISGIYFYDWSNGDVTNDIEELSTGTYYVTVTDMNDCQVSDSVFVPLVENDCNIDLIIYNLVTPNGDGQNDYWIIENIEIYEGAVVEVYNEWGNLVFSTNDYSEPWDGKDKNGKQVAAGTYYYIITLPNGVSYNGYLTVMY